MIGTIRNPRAVSTVAESFGLAARRARERGNRSVERELRGERAFSEPGYTENLLEDLDLSIRTELDRIEIDGLRVVSTGFNFPVRDETEYGADIGVRVDIETPGYVVSKALLFQCKRRYADNGFPEIRGRGEDQAKNMLSVTPASFFLLFNSGTQRELAELAWGSLHRSAEWFWGRPWHEFEAGGSAFDLGIAVIPASRILGLSNGAGFLDQTRLPTDPSTILSGAVPFGIFMADMVCSCLVGDPRPMVVQLVTPPKDARAAADEVGASFFDFHIQRYMHIRLFGVARDTAF